MLGFPKEILKFLTLVPWGSSWARFQLRVSCAKLREGNFCRRLIIKDNQLVLDSLRKPLINSLRNPDFLKEIPYFLKEILTSLSKPLIP